MKVLNTNKVINCGAVYVWSSSIQQLIQFTSNEQVLLFLVRQNVTLPV